MRDSDGVRPSRDMKLSKALPTHWPRWDGCHLQNLSALSRDFDVIMWDRVWHLEF